MIVIIGAGPAGLAAASALSSPHIVLEQLDAPGGLCRSFQVGKSTFDFGGHAFFTSDQEVRDLIERHAAQPLYKQPRAAWIWSHGTYLRYPFQANLAGLPTSVIEDCLVGLLERPTDAGDGSFSDWLLRTFGPGVHRHFLEPYNQKVWAYPLSSIVPLWAGERIVQPNTRAIIRGALAETHFDDFPNAEVRYPAQGGFFELFRPLSERASAQTRLGVAAQTLDLAGRKVLTGQGEPIAYDRVISTMPLPELVRISKGVPTDISQAALELDHNSLILVSISARAPQAQARHRIYCADPDVLFHKLVFNETSSPALAAQGVVSIQAEISYSHHKPVAAGEALANTVSTLLRMGVLNDPSQIECTDVRQVEFGYPVYTRRSITAARKICDYFEDHGVLSIGRFGEWAYINSDGAVRRGLDAARHVERAKAERLSRLHSQVKIAAE